MSHFTAPSGKVHTGANPTGLSNTGANPMCFSGKVYTAIAHPIDAYTTPKTIAKRIAFTGRKGAGKSTLTEALVSRGYHEIAFAEPLKQLIVKLFGIEPKWVYDPDLKEQVIPKLGVSGRALCQVIGTELFRDALRRCLPDLRLRGECIWIHAAFEEMERYPERDIVVSDCRFPDEYTALQAAGFTTYNIVRTTDKTNEIKEDHHASEQGCPSDAEILNRGSRDEFLETGVAQVL